MSAYEDASKHALGVAMNLINMGMPMVVSKPCKHSVDSTYTTCPGIRGECTKGFENRPFSSYTLDAMEIFEQWQPGRAIMARTGIIIDAIDVDPEGSVKEAVEKLSPSAIVGSATTPRGGMHIIIPPTGHSVAVGVITGVDYRGEGGIIFIAPTERLSPSGEIVRYEWLEAPSGEIPKSGTVAWPSPEVSADPFAETEKLLTGTEPIAAGTRDNTVYRIACAYRGTRDRLLSRDRKAALAHFMRNHFWRIEQPQGNEFTRAEVEAKFEQAWGSYGPGWVGDDSDETVATDVGLGDNIPASTDYTAISKRVRAALELRYAKGRFHKHEKNVWVPYDEIEFSDQLWRALDGMTVMKPGGKAGPVPGVLMPNRALVGEVLAATRAYVRKEFPVALEVIPCANVLVNAVTGATVAHSPATSLDYVVPFDYMPTAKCLQWLEFLESIGLKADDQMLLAQWFGYVLSGRTDLQKMLYIDGPPRSGKGTILRVLEALVGQEKGAGKSLETLPDWGLGGLATKRLATFGDVRIGADADKQAIIRILLSIIGEDSVEVNIKYAQPYSTRIPARIACAGNGIPWFSDHSGAFAARMLILRTTESFVNREDPALGERLLAELPGIFNWALNGLRSLTKAGRFTESLASTMAVEDQKMHMSPILSFFDRDECAYLLTGDMNDSVPSKELALAYFDWEADIDPVAWVGMRRTLKVADATRFGMILSSAPANTAKRKVMQGGKRESRYFGVARKAVHKVGHPSAEVGHLSERGS